MKHLIALVLSIYSCWANGAETFPTIEAYLERATGKPNAALAWDAASHSSPPGKRVFGIVRGEQMATVVILDEQPGGEVREVASSKPFAFFDPKDRMKVESVEAQSDKRFSIQIGFQNVCSTPFTFDLYRFTRIGQSWYVSGLDSTRCLWGDEGEAGGDSRMERSSNFLTGKVIERKFRKNMLVSERSKKTPFPQFPLAEFVPFDERHGPR